MRRAAIVQFFVETTAYLHSVFFDVTRTLHVPSSSHLWSLLMRVLSPSAARSVNVKATI